MAKRVIPACVVLKSPTDTEPALILCRQCGASDRLPQNVRVESFLGFMRGFASGHRDCGRAWKKKQEADRG